MVVFCYTTLVTDSCMQHDQTLLVVFAPWFCFKMLCLFGLSPV